MAKKTAQYAINKLLSVDSVPGLSGQIQIAIYDQGTKKNTYLEIDFEPQNKLNITKYSKKKNTWNIIEDEELVSFEDIKLRIDKFGEEIWKDSSEYYQDAIFIKAWEDTQVKPLQTMKEEYRSYKSFASSALVPIYAVI